MLIWKQNFHGKENLIVHKCAKLTKSEGPLQRPFRMTPPLKRIVREVDGMLVDQVLHLA